MRLSYHLSHWSQLTVVIKLSFGSSELNCTLEIIEPYQFEPVASESGSCTEPPDSDIIDGGVGDLEDEKRLLSRRR